MLEVSNAVALDLLAQARRAEPLRISRQVLRKYLAVVTRPQTWASPLPMPDALLDVRRFASDFEVLEDGQAVTDMLATLCRDVSVAGKQVHDANIVATMLTHGGVVSPLSTPRTFAATGNGSSYSRSRNAAEAWREVVRNGSAGPAQLPC